LTVSGKRFTGKQLNQVRETVETFQTLSRNELAFTLCEHLNWVTPQGKNVFLRSCNIFEGLTLILDK